MARIRTALRHSNRLKTDSMLYNRPFHAKELTVDFEKHLVLLGRDAHFIREACDAIGYGDYTFCKDMEECVRTAAALASPGDVVLLSPACASWDMYNNFEQRGDHFKDCVSRL